jgi:hypothetical protein
LFSLNEDEAVAVLCLTDVTYEKYKIAIGMTSQFAE